MGAQAELPLVGRDRELAELRELLQRAKNGTREATVLEGEAGIGKTRLIDEAIGYATDLGFTIFEAAADESDRSRIFGVLTDAFGGDADRRRRLNDLLGRWAPTAADRRVALIDELVSIIESTTASAPVAVVLDDLHWSDAEALRVLRALVRRVRALPVAFISATRPSPADVELERLIEAVTQSGGRYITVEPLDDEAVASLIAEVHAVDPAPDLRERVASANGNPFFVIEVIAAGLDQPRTTELPQDLRRTVLRRLAHLSDEAKTLVRFGALLGPSIHIADLAAVLGRSSIELVPTLNEAVKGGIVEDRGDSFAFRHDIVRDAVYADMPEPVRKLGHRDVARALIASSVPARRVAMHLHAAAEPGDGEAIAWLRRAATEEAQRSPTVAADMLDQAIELLHPTDPALESLQAERVQMLAWAGRLAEASTLGNEVLSRLRDHELAVSVRAALGQALFFRGHLVEAGEHFEQASVDAPRSERGFLMAEAGVSRAMNGQLSRAQELIDEALAEGSATDDPRARSLAAGVNGMMVGARGDYSGLSLARDAVWIADEDPTGEAHRYGARLYLGLALIESDRFDEAMDVLRRGIRLDELNGVAWSRPCYHSAIGQQFFFRGEWDDAVAEFETAEALLDDMGSALYGPFTHGFLAYIAIHRDDPSRAAEELAMGEADLASAGPQLGGDLLARTRALIAEDAGDTTTATTILRVMWQLADAIGFRLGLRHLGPDYIRLLVAQGERDAARAAAKAVELLVPTAPTRSVAGTALLCRGMAEEDAATLLQAVTTLRTAGRPMDFAMACEQAAAAVEETGEAKRARDLRHEAIAVYETLGAHRDIRLASEALRGPAAGRKRAKPERPVTGWESLSPTERRVAALVAEGLSNAAIGERMFISHRTAETHLTHIFRKIGISSRVELAVRASRREL